MEETENIRRQFQDIVESLPRAPGPEGEGFAEWTRNGIESMRGMAETIESCTKRPRPRFLKQRPPSRSWMWAVALAWNSPISLTEHQTRRLQAWIKPLECWQSCERNMNPAAIKSHWSKRHAWNGRLVWVGSTSRCRF